mmetsp:Transcript_15825/g.47513  ORF Transcript_15825/g.47513 Transcript_15825/m.47513 type:complete len:256 (-) Transcript_15825:2218-2985(-)
MRPLTEALQNTAVVEAFALLLDAAVQLHRPEGERLPDVLVAHLVGQLLPALTQHRKVGHGRLEDDLRGVKVLIDVTLGQQCRDQAHDHGRDARRSSTRRSQAAVQLAGGSRRRCLASRRGLSSFGTLTRRGAGLLHHGRISGGGWETGHSGRHMQLGDGARKLQASLGTLERLKHAQHLVLQLGKIGRVHGEQLFEELLQGQRHIGQVRSGGGTLLSVAHLVRGEVTERSDDAGVTGVALAAVARCSAGAALRRR